MLPHIEKEYKMMISKEDYEFYLRTLPLQTIKQTNFYYITSTQHCAMRIRQIDNRYIFTLKVKEKDYHEEYECEVASCSLDYPEIQSILKEHNILDYQYIGQMETLRSYRQYQYGELCIDKSTYFDKTDYEMEFELHDYQNENIKEFLEILKLRSLQYLRSPHSKFKRFLIQKELQ